MGGRTATAQKKPMGSGRPFDASLIDIAASAGLVEVQLIGTKSNRSAIGARILASYGGDTQAQEVLSQSSYYSCNDSRLHFGLGSAAPADLSVRWPRGATKKYPKVKCDQLITIREAHGFVPNMGWAR
jgi:hypothetical protein